MRKEHEIIVGDCREVLAGLAEGSVHCCVTSPPYWALRDYGTEGQLGVEPTPDSYLATMVDVFRAVWRVMRDDATLWLNIGDGYASGGRSTYRSAASDNKGHQVQDEMPRPATPDGLKPKDLIGMPWRLALALQADGWYLRSDIIWAKPNPMPESVTDRPTKSHEHVFLLTKKPRYFYDAEAVKEGVTGNTHSKGKKLDPPIGNAGIGHKEWHRYTPDLVTSRNLRDVWTIPTEPFSEAHFATFPRTLVEPCIKAGTSDKGCCPECGTPWRRVVEKDRQATRPARNNCRDDTGMANRDYERHVTESRTVGWEPGCECGGKKASDGVWRGQPYKPLTPCTVLDPFAGSGTTGVVATQLGRRFVGIELNPEYAEMARKRIDNPEPVAKAVEVTGQMMLVEGPRW